MNLRVRLAIALAALTALAATAMGAVSYASTETRLVGALDRMLATRASGFAQAHDAGFRFSSATPVDERGDPLPLKFDVDMQILARDGTAVDRSGGLDVPIDEADRLLARAVGPARVRTAVIDGDPYRVRTEHLASGGGIQVARSLSETDEVLGELRTRLLLIGLAVVAAGVLAGWLIARRTSRPIEDLTAAAERVASTGDLGTPVPGTGRDEAGRLARAFTEMLGALARSREQQQHLVEDASHELRTPLTSMRTNVDILARHSALPDEQRAAIVEDVRSELRELAGLIDELVELAREQRPTAPAEAVELLSVTERAATHLRRRYGRDVEVTGEPTSVMGHAQDLQRAVANLLDNAAKFSPPGTRIAVDVGVGGVRVRDRGPGFTPADLPRLFDRFYRSAAARQLPGSGLGLAIVRETVERHGGRVFARNHPDGGGEVGFELPIGRAAGR